MSVYVGFNLVLMISERGDADVHLGGILRLLFPSSYGRMSVFQGEYEINPYQYYYYQSYFL